MTTTLTIKGQVTIPKEVREAAGLKPGDKVDVRATATGGVYIEKPGKVNDYAAKIREVAKRQIIRGITTDELMEMTRGEPGSAPSKKKKK